MRPGRNSPAIALVGSSILVMVLVVSILYIGREILIPLALAMLITFLLTPLVSRLERLARPRCGCCARRVDPL